MIYLLHGTDTDKSRSKMHEMVDSLKKKKPDAAYFKMDAEHWNLAELEEYCGGQGLFENKFIIVLDHLLDNEEIAPVLLEQIEAIAESPNIFIVLEGKLDKDTLKKVEKHAEKFQEFEESTAQKFAKEAGMKDFPFNKAKSYANNFSEKESDELLNRLIGISHDSRRGLSDISLSLEELTLTV